MAQVETTNDFLAVRTVCGQVLAWYPSDKFPYNLQTDVSVARSWNVTYRNRWPSHVVPVADLVTSVNGMATDGRQVRSRSSSIFSSVGYSVATSFSSTELNEVESIGLGLVGLIE